ncbi:sensor histidine kinase [Caulobacter endophyticus]|uniref:sensor histidine kinase n=1 Tax=Caulobacter endophyticus TaxID=2172652 RepID=UPI00240F4AD6|nr:HWE histidine kinase domain-containing protein [Caulobacter endophyticus]MDG2531003.1 HWE histidine kinase domain-containing protein [Caulobacter endophyticus]
MTGPIDFAAVFDRLPTPYMMLDRDLRYVAANQAYLDTLGRTWAELDGAFLFEAFPSDGESRERLESSLLRARDSGKVDHLPLIPYAIERPAHLGGGFEDRIWSATHTPIPGPDGRTAYIVQHTQDVTAIQRLKEVAFGRGEMAMLQDDVLLRAGAAGAQNDDLRRLFMQAPSFMAVLRGPEHRFDLVNNAYTQLIGWRDVVGLPLREALPEVVEQGFVTLLDRVTATAEAFIGREIKVALQRTPDGPLEDRFLDFIYQPIIEPDGSVSGVLVEGSDVTDKVLAGEQQRLLLDELNHRVKNTLATVQAIARQTLRGALTPEAFARAFEARLLALSQTHNALTDSQWAGAGLRQILSQELAPYDPARIAMEGPDVNLPARIALSLGMVFHELATNAAKYGALSTEAGRLRLTWSVVNDALGFEWREEGGPPVTAPTRHGFGSRLIERSIGAELRGQVAIDYAQGGLICRFTVSMDRVF